MDSLKLRRLFLPALLLLLTLLGSGILRSHDVLAKTSPADKQGLDPFLSMQNRIKAISREVNPKVVHIEAFLKIENMTVGSTGTGILADKNGHILTNNHVVSKAEKVTVQIPGHKEKYPAKIIGTDQQTDLAILKIKLDYKADPARFGDSSKATVGDWVIAIGNPYGLDGTVSFGIISAIQRNLNVGGLLNEFIQTDAMIDFGSSGGPLVNMEGEVIGINSRGQGRGIGFTIPINTALEIKEKLIQGGEVERSWLGVTIQPLERELATSLGLSKASGVIINQVHEGSSAEKSGMKPGDILTHFDQNVLEAENDREIPSVTRTITQTPIGKKVEMRIIRDGKPKKLYATMMRQPKLEGDQAETNLGFNVQEITKFLSINHRLKSRKGVYVSFVEIGSVADEAQLRKGDIIQRLDKRDIHNLKDFEKKLASVNNQKRTLVQVLREESIIFLLLKNDRKKPKGSTSSS